MLKLAKLSKQPEDVIHMGLYPGRISVLSVENPTIPTPVEGGSYRLGGRRRPMSKGP